MNAIANAYFLITYKAIRRGGLLMISAQAEKALVEHILKTIAAEFDGN